MTTTILTTASVILAAPEQASAEAEPLKQATDEKPKHAGVA
jgi:BarA-like signal transduction histidine kinase